MTKKIKRSYGRVVVADKRDKKFLMTTRTTRRKFRYWSDNRYWGDQLSTPHCVGYSFMHWLTNAPIVSYIDPDGIYKLAKQHDVWRGEDYDGTSVRAGAKVLKMLGLISEYRWCVGVADLANAILTQSPVVVGTDWTEGMETPDADNRIHATGEVIGGHAYLITGVSLTRKVFRIKNSWGREWGADGRAYISFADMAKLLSAGGEACLAQEMRAMPPVHMAASASASASKKRAKITAAKQLAPATGTARSKPWGTTKLSFAYNGTESHVIRVDAGGYCSTHSHVGKWNRFLGVSGRLKIFKLNEDGTEDCTTLSHSQLVDVPPGVRHRFESVDGAVAIEYYWTELDPDDIDRSGTKGGTKPLVTRAVRKSEPTEKAPKRPAAMKNPRKVEAKKRAKARSKRQRPVE